MVLLISSKEADNWNIFRLSYHNFINCRLLLINAKRIFECYLYLVIIKIKSREVILYFREYILQNALNHSLEFAWLTKLQRSLSYLNSVIPNNSLRYRLSLLGTAYNFQYQTNSKHLLDF